MNNKFHKNIPIKAGIFACLFSFVLGGSYAQDWRFTDSVQRVYQNVLNLQPAGADEYLRHVHQPEASYVANLAEAIELLITEDNTKLTLFEKRYLKRLELLNGTSKEIQFVAAEMKLHWTFIYLKFGRELDAAMSLREAYIIAADCRANNPEFVPIYKTTGLLEIMIGSLPEKYGWVLSMLGIEGNVASGISALQRARKSQSTIAPEATLIWALVQGFLLQQPNLALTETKRLVASDSTNNLLKFLTANLAIKNSESEFALTLLDSLSSRTDFLSIPYVHYLKGEVLLHKGQYQNAISAYELFAMNYKGQNYLKDAYYKIGLCHWLNGNNKDAKDVFQLAKIQGSTTTEADRHAARRLVENHRPNIKLTKARYFTDGGYYAQAEQALSELNSSDLPSRSDQTEYYYRKARLGHKTGNANAAKIFYKQVVDMTNEEDWYFAPNACLQLGYISMEQGDKEEAAQWFTRALAYKSHEYKNSIDTKAQSALDQLSTR